MITPNVIATSYFPNKCGRVFFSNFSIYSYFIPCFRFFSLVHSPFLNVRWLARIHWSGAGDTDVRIYRCWLLWLPGQRLISNHSPSETISSLLTLVVCVCCGGRHWCPCITMDHVHLFFLLNFFSFSSSPSPLSFVLWTFVSAIRYRFQSNWQRVMTTNRTVWLNSIQN